MSKIKAIVYVEEEALEQLKKDGASVYATDRDAFILPAFSHNSILEYVRDNAEDEKFIKALDANSNLKDMLLSSITHHLDGALYGFGPCDGSLSWEEACYCFDDAVEAIKEKYHGRIYRA